MLLLNLFLEQALAQTAAAPSPEAPSMLTSLFPMVLIFAVFYFIVLRPQSKRSKDHQKFLTELKRGEEVLTASGILGRIEGLTEQYVTLLIAPEVSIRIVRSQIAGRAQPAEAKKGS